MKLSEIKEPNKQYSSEELDSKKLIKALTDNCSEAIASFKKSPMSRLWRGSKTKRSSGIYNPSSGERSSANTGNYYTKLLDSNELNSEFPLRSKSFICTTSVITGAGYGKKGTMYALFPFNGAKLGQVNQEDIWYTKIKFNGQFHMQETLKSMNDLWPELHQAMGKPRNWTPTLDELMDWYDNENRAEDFVQEMQDQGYMAKGKSTKEYAMKCLGNFIDQLPEAYSYQKLGCTLKTPSSFIHPDSEVWVADKVILVNEFDYDLVQEEFGIGS